jgi:hypothetical protein
MHGLMAGFADGYQPFDGYFPDVLFCVFFTDDIIDAIVGVPGMFPYPSGIVPPTLSYTSPTHTPCLR